MGRRYTVLSINWQIGKWLLQNDMMATYPRGKFLHHEFALLTNWAFGTSQTFDKSLNQSWPVLKQRVFPTTIAIRPGTFLASKARAEASAQFMPTSIWLTQIPSSSSTMKLSSELYGIHMESLDHIVLYIYAVSTWKNNPPKVVNLGRPRFPERKETIGCGNACDKNYCQGKGAKTRAWWPRVDRFPMVSRVSTCFTGLPEMFYLLGNSMIGGKFRA